MPPPTFPHRIACLCELRDARGRVLLIHRARDPNRGLYSPIGGKLETAAGESPAQCARREIREEAGIDVPLDRLHLAGIVSERGFGSAPGSEAGMNWLMFWYRVLGPVDVRRETIPEGRLEWHAVDEIMALPLPETDRLAIWPTVLDHADGGFFALHLDCAGPEIHVHLEESRGRRAGSPAR